MKYVEMAGDDNDSGHVLEVRTGVREMIGKSRLTTGVRGCGRVQAHKTLKGLHRGGGKDPGDPGGDWGDGAEAQQHRTMWLEKRAELYQTNQVTFTVGTGTHSSPE